MPEPEVTDEQLESLSELELTKLTENPDLYTVQAADLNAYPELSQQVVQLYDQVPYDSLTVNKWATAEQISTVSEPWPRKVGDTTHGITFKG